MFEMAFHIKLKFLIIFINATGNEQVDFVNRGDSTIQYLEAS